MTRDQARIGLNKVISDKTLIPLGFAITLIGGGVGWMASLHADVEYNKKTIAETHSNCECVMEKIADLKADVAEIKGELKVILEELKHR